MSSELDSGISTKTEFADLKDANDNEPQKVMSG